MSMLFINKQKNGVGESAFPWSG